MKLGYLAIDQYGQQIKIDKHPRKELLDYFGYKKASKMYRDSKSGAPKHIGYVIGNHWLTVYEVHEWVGKCEQSN